jgi:hypothetical protein
MEVASPIQLVPTAGGSKRSLTCSPQLVDPSGLLNTSDMSIADDTLSRAPKRCRFQTDATMEDLSQSFSSHSIFFRNTLSQTLSSSKNNLLPSNTCTGKSIELPKRSKEKTLLNISGRLTSLPLSYPLPGSALKRNRFDVPSPATEELKKALAEHISTIESLRNEKSELQSSLQSVKTDHERVVKENNILRRAVTIQQERHNNTENDLKVARKQNIDAQERIRGLEQVIISLRYHLQAQQNHCETDFLHHRSPDVF